MYTSTGGGSEKFNKADQVHEIASIQGTAKWIRTFNIEMIRVKGYMVGGCEINSVVGRVVNTK